MDLRVPQQQWIYVLQGRRYVCWPSSTVVPRTVPRPEVDTKLDESRSEETQETKIFTVIRLPGPCANSNNRHLRQLLRQLYSDELFTNAFANYLQFCQHDGTSFPTDDDTLANVPTWLDTVHPVFGNILTPGPFLTASGGKPIPIYHLSDDTQDVFGATFRPLETVEASVRDTDSADQMQYEYLQAVSTNGQHKALAIRPGAAILESGHGGRLSGMHMAVKDMFDICNHRTSLGSRAFHRISTPSQRTAPAIQALVHAGARLVGTTLMCAMIGKQEPTQSVDYPAPFNPRADGFQSPSGGSNGSPAAVAAYSWLDFAIGSDSTVSGRLPAQANGCFSFRPSTGSVSTEGMFSGVPQFDTPCVFARDLKVLSAVAETWLEGFGAFEEPEGEFVWSLPTPALHYLIDSLPTEVPDQMRRLEHFVQEFAAFLELDVKRSSLEQLWSDDPPAPADGTHISEFLDLTLANETYVYEVWRRISKFVDQYHAIVGEDPFMPLPSGIHLWDDVKTTTQEQSDKAWQKLGVYKKWLVDHVFKFLHEDTVVVMPLEPVKPRYRDEWPKTPPRQQLWEPLLLAPILGAPEVVVPIGQLEFDSRISGQVEHLPVCVSVMGRPGKDKELLDVVTRFLRSSGRPTSVMAGRTMFPPEPVGV